MAHIFAGGKKVQTLAHVKGWRMVTGKWTTGEWEKTQKSHHIEEKERTGSNFVKQTLPFPNILGSLTIKKIIALLPMFVNNNYKAPC